VFRVRGDVHAFSDEIHVWVVGVDDGISASVKGKSIVT
jgi:hypothetical protein